jgi:FixJ family two-component response regulator
MPRLRGTELAARLLEIDCDLPVIVMSGDVARLADATNVHAFLQKPVAIDTLLAAIDGVYAPLS